MFLKNRLCLLSALLSSCFLLHGMSNESNLEKEKYYYDYNDNELNPYLEQVKQLKDSELEAACVILDWRKKEVIILKDNFNLPITNSSKDISRV